MMNKRILTLCFFVCSVSFLLSQSVEFEKDNFPGRKEELKAARKQLDIGLEFYLQGRKEFDDFRKGLTSDKKLPVSTRDYLHVGNENFKNALSPLSDAQRFNPKNATLNYILGFIKFMDNPSSKEALSHFSDAYRLNPEVEQDLPYWLAWCYQLNVNWDEAIRYYNIYLGRLNAKPKGLSVDIEDVQKKIMECTNGKKYAAKPERVFVDNLGPAINSQYPEYSPAITADEETMILTARRDNSTGGKKDADAGYYEDLYISTKTNGKWMPSKLLSKHVNTEAHDASAGLSPDGSKLFVYRHSGKDGGDLYETTLFGADWEPPAHMNKNINTKFHESSVSLTFDGRRIYFVSDKSGGFGDRDIYYSDMDVKGEWGLAKNVGPEINTKYGEEGVFMHPDGKSMYFSSQGHDNMGGYDIFVSTFENGKWGKPVNLGYPINGPDDDVFFVVSGSGNRAYFSSSKQGGYGDKDIYKITFLGPEKEPLLSTEDQLLAMVANPISNLKTEAAVEIKTAKLTILKGVITDAKTNAVLEAMIDLIDNDKNEVLATFKSNSATGKYLVTLPSGKNYGIAVKRDGYLFHSENFNLPDDADYQEFNKDVALKKIEVGSTIVLRNIFFDFDKATIRPESANELDRLIKLLNDNPTLKIELGSHTDSKGSDDYNWKLSDSRSKSVVEYLIGKGISAGRLVAKGYGETKPIDTNDNDAGRQNNRRTEFKILEK
jgi:outer membrane protein OmpA-like peptidoglycan-associated protein/Tol biopolymer transport system component